MKGTERTVEGWGGMWYYGKSGWLSSHSCEKFRENVASPLSTHTPELTFPSSLMQSSPISQASHCDSALTAGPKGKFWSPVLAGYLILPGIPHSFGIPTTLIRPSGKSDQLWSVIIDLLQKRSGRFKVWRPHFMLHHLGAYYCPHPVQSSWQNFYSHKEAFSSSGLSIKCLQRVLSYRTRSNYYCCF